MRTVTLVATAILFAVEVIAIIPQTAVAQDLKRWAILPSAVPDASLHDLVNIEVGRIAGVELIEREALQLVTDEHIRSLLGIHGTGNCPKIGRLLKADALVLLSMESHEKSLALKVVIVECTYGARLCTIILPYRPDGLEAMAKTVAESIANTRQRMAKGVKWLATVPHFVSRDFTHRFDYLQTSCATVIENAIAEIPGVAVVETEEAQSIRRELETVGGELSHRLVPLLIEGEYQTSPAKEGNIQVQFHIWIRNGKQVIRDVRPSPVDLQSVGDCLGRLVRDEIIPAANIDPQLLVSSKQQFIALTGRAAVFSEVGSWDHSTGLREAAVLLDPQAADQRLLLVKEYMGILQGLCAKINHDTKPSVQTILTHRAEIWRTGLGHLEYLIRNRQISLGEAPNITAEFLHVLQFAYAQGYKLPFDYCAEIKRFLRAVVPMGETLPSETLAPLPRKWKLQTWWNIPLQHATRWAFDLRSNDDYRTRFAFLLEVMEEWVPENALPGADLCFRLADNAPKNHDFCVVYIAFLQRLAQSKRQMNAVCGRFGLIVYDYWRQQSAAPERLPELEALATICRRVKSRSTDHHTGLGLLEGRITYYHNTIQRQLKPDSNKSRTPIRSKSADISFGRLRFEPLALIVKSLANGDVSQHNRKWRTHSGWGGLTRWTSCGSRLDVVWNAGVILFMHQINLLDEVFVDPKPVFEDVRWDGRHIWIATRHEGIWIVEPSGILVARITEDDGLPPADRGLLLHVLSEGRLAAVGAFGEHHRAWCAILSRNGDKTVVNVFHRAAFVPPKDNTRWQEHERNPQTVFEPSWMHVYQPRNELEAPRLLVGRRWFPLLVNLQTLEVSSYPDNPWPKTVFPGIGRCSESYYSYNGKLLVAGCRGVGVYELDADGLSVKLVRKPDTADLHSVIFSYGGWVYYAGYRWSRFDPKTLEEQKLTDSDLPVGYTRLLAAPSSHYGIVALDGHGSPGGKIYRVHIQKTTSSNLGEIKK